VPAEVQHDGDEGGGGGDDEGVKSRTTSLRSLSISFFGGGGGVLDSASGVLSLFLTYFATFAWPLPGLFFVLP